MRAVSEFTCCRWDFGNLEEAGRKEELELGNALRTPEKLSVAVFNIPNGKWNRFENLETDINMQNESAGDI